MKLVFIIHIKVNCWDCLLWSHWLLLDIPFVMTHPNAMRSRRNIFWLSDWSLAEWVIIQIQTVENDHCFSCKMWKWWPIHLFTSCGLSFSPLTWKILMIFIHHNILHLSSAKLWARQLRQSSYLPSHESLLLVIRISIYIVYLTDSVLKTICGVTMWKIV